MCKSMYFVVDFPPTPWKRPAGKTQRFDSQVVEKAAFALLVWEQIKSAVPCIQSEPVFPAHLPLEVSMLFKMVKPKTSKLSLPTSKNDVDNLAKFVLDALQSNSLQGRIWNDDGQIVHLTSTKSWGEKDSITVYIKEVIA